MGGTLTAGVGAAAGTGAGAGGGAAGAAAGARGGSTPVAGRAVAATGRPARPAAAGAALPGAAAAAPHLLAAGGARAALAAGAPRAHPPGRQRSGAGRAAVGARAAAPLGGPRRQSSWCLPKSSTGTGARVSAWGADGAVPLASACMRCLPAARPFLLCSCPASATSSKPSVCTLTPEPHHVSQGSQALLPPLSLHIKASAPIKQA